MNKAANQPNKQGTTLIYTKTDEAPALATYAFYPVVQAFCGKAGVAVESRDISLAGRILAQFPDRLSEDQRVPDDLAGLGELVKQPEANIIKLPNISASVPQLKAAVAELQAKGYDLPDYPEEPASEEEREVRRRYDRVKGSAVNPVLREGNSDRRAPRAVKAYAQKHPHRMGEWASDSRTHVASMAEGDFYGSERSLTAGTEGTFAIRLVREDGSVQELKGPSPLEEGEVIDAAVMRRRALREFLRREMADAREKGVLFSIHLKATMMKVSDPLIFGEAVSVYFEDLFAEQGERLRELGFSPSDGVGDLLKRAEALPAAEKEELLEVLDRCYKKGPDLAMVDSDRGITNLHVPSDVIIDASMPAAIRSGGKMWNRRNEQQDMKAVIPDRSYAGVYQRTIEFCQKNGALDPAKLGSVSNVGLMARKAEEYGSHDKTFQVSEAGTVQVIGAGGEVLLEQRVEPGDIFRMCQAKDGPIRDWVGLAVRRARETGVPAVFWLDERRAHDRELRAKVSACLKQENTDGLDIRVMNPEEATQFSLEEMTAGRDVISVTGNVLRDYLTDLFPILEVGTSAKMLSIVPLMAGGGLFETGAGGSAPKHVQQFLGEGHLRWDSLGEYLALAVSLEHLAKGEKNPKARVLAEALDKAAGRYLEEDKGPSRKVKERDNRGSHFYLTLYWAEALAEQTEDRELQKAFGPAAREMREQEAAIMAELNGAQGASVDLGGYYLPDDEKARRALRPSGIWNRILGEI